MSLLKRIMGKGRKNNITDDQATLINPPVKEPIACPANVPIDEHQKAVQVEQEEIKKIEDKENEQQKQVILTHKEFKALKKAKYEDIQEKYDTAYTIQNKKTKKVVTLRAASVIMACNIIGWRPRHVKLIETTIIEKKVNPEEMKKVEVKEVMEEKMPTPEAPEASVVSG